MTARAPLPRLAACALALLLAACAPSARDAGDVPPSAASTSVTSASPTSPVAPAVAATPPASTPAPTAPAPTAPIATSPAPTAGASAAPAMPAESTHRDAPARPIASTPATPDDRCGSDADCTVKDVGSCCGYSPRCLNQSSRPDPDAVRARCAKDGRVGICGFREVSGCQCVSGRCAALPSPGGGLVQ